MNKTRVRTVTGADGIRIYYEVYGEYGSQTPVFLLHGVGGDLDAWEFVKDMLVVAGYSCIAIDLRGHGKSSHPFRFADYELSAFIEDFMLVLKAEKVPRVVLVGHSLGAVLALHIALRCPEQVEKLVIISGNYQIPWYVSVPGAAFLIRAISCLSLPPIRPGHSVYPVGKHHKDFELLGLVRTIFRNSLRSYLLASAGILSTDMSSRVATIRIPTLIISGTKDSVFPTRLSEALHSLIPGSELKIIPGGNHVLILNAIDETVAFITSFLRSDASQREV